MIVYCADCKMYYDDTYRLTLCPHPPFNANDGNNNFKVHYDSYYSSKPPSWQNPPIENLPTY